MRNRLIFTLCFGGPALVSSCGQKPNKVAEQETAEVSADDADPFNN